MGYSRADKARSREKILATAARQIREQGLDSVTVGSLMRSADLTHGGFYGHFDSRADLVARALERALLDGREAFEAHNAEGTINFAATVRGYLSRRHRDSAAEGCAIAALAADAARAEPEVRATMSAALEFFIGRVADALDDPDQQQAMFAVSALIGGLLVSRSMADPARADAVLAAVRHGLLAAAPLPPASASPSATSPSTASSSTTQPSATPGSAAPKSAAPGSEARRPAPRRSRPARNGSGD